MTPRRPSASWFSCKLKTWYPRGVLRVHIIRKSLGLRAEGVVPVLIFFFQSRYSVARKLNQGSNSWMIRPYSGESNSARKICDGSWNIRSGDSDAFNRYKGCKIKIARETGQQKVICQGNTCGRLPLDASAYTETTGCVYVAAFVESIKRNIRKRSGSERVGTWRR